MSFSGCHAGLVVAQVGGAFDGKTHQPDVPQGLEVVLPQALHKRATHRQDLELEEHEAVVQLGSSVDVV